MAFSPLHYHHHHPHQSHHQQAHLNGSAEANYYNYAAHNMPLSMSGMLHHQAVMNNYSNGSSSSSSTSSSISPSQTQLNDSFSFNNANSSSKKSFNSSAFNGVHATLKSSQRPEVVIPPCTPSPSLHSPGAPLTRAGNFNSSAASSSNYSSFTSTPNSFSHQDQAAALEYLNNYANTSSHNVAADSEAGSTNVFATDSAMFNGNHYHLQSASSPIQFATNHVESGQHSAEPFYAAISCYPTQMPYQANSSASWYGNAADTRFASNYFVIIFSISNWAFGFS